MEWIIAAFDLHQSSPCARAYSGLMDKRSRDILRRRLEARAAQLRGEVGAALHASEALGLPNHRTEVDDDAVADLETSLDVASVERDARELEEVSAALARIDGPNFGSCATCERPIAWERLLAQPQATHCVKCEALAEKRAPSRL
jgi:DnaK suppressor protein